MARPWCHVLVPLLLLSFFTGTAATLASSFPITERVGPGVTNKALTENSPAPQDTNISLTSFDFVTSGPHFHISGTPIELGFTFFGPSVPTGSVFRLVELAVDNISANLSVRPAESISHGFFQQRYQDLEINVAQYSGKHITWSTLSQLLLGIQYYTQNSRNSRVLEFEIDILNMGRAGYGSLQYASTQGLDLEQRAAVAPSLQLPNLNISQNYPSNMSSHLMLPTFEDEHIIFSFHASSKSIPASALATSFQLLRHVIRNNVRLHPEDSLEGGRFTYTPDRTRVEFTVKADVGKELTWLLLDNIVTGLAASRWTSHVLREFDFAFELFPFEEEYGNGTVRYLL